MNKISSLQSSFQRAAGGVIAATERVSEWTCEGGRKAHSASNGRREAARKKCGCVLACHEWAMSQFRWYRRDVSLCPNV